MVTHGVSEIPVIFSKNTMDPRSPVARKGFEHRTQRRSQSAQASRCIPPHGRSYGRNTCDTWLGVFLMLISDRFQIAMAYWCMLNAMGMGLLGLSLITMKSIIPAFPICTSKLGNNGKLWTIMANSGKLWSIYR